MRTIGAYVRARIDQDTKERAAEALEAMGLSISDAIRLLMRRIADERCLPFGMKVPNAITHEAMTELEAGKGQRFDSVDTLMADLNADDWAGYRECHIKPDLLLIYRKPDEETLRLARLGYHGELFD